MRQLLLSFLAVIALTSLMVAAGNDASRVKSLTGKVLCNCGCDEILSECSHTDCKAKASLKQEIASAVQSGRMDDLILSDMEKKYGTSILVVPSFRGFNRLLWVVPIAFGVIAGAIVVWRRWLGAAEAQRR